MREEFIATKCDARCEQSMATALIKTQQDLPGRSRCACSVDEPSQIDLPGAGLGVLVDLSMAKKRKFEKKPSLPKKPKVSMHSLPDEILVHMSAPASMCQGGRTSQADAIVPA